MPSKPLPDRIILRFPDDFPDGKMAGQSIFLDPEVEGKTIWWIGRAKTLQSGPAELPVDITIRGEFISRAHCTIFWQFDQWYLMDGVYFPIADDEMITATDFKPGEYKPSHNGTWVDGKRLGYREPHLLSNGSRIVFGSYGYRAIVLAPDDTLNTGVWNDNQWPNVVPMTVIEEGSAPPLHPTIESQLIEEARAKVSTPPDPEIESQWEMGYRLISEFGRWAFSTPVSTKDFLFRILILALTAALVHRAAELLEIYLKR